MFIYYCLFMILLKQHTTYTEIEINQNIIKCTHASSGRENKIDSVYFFILFLFRLYLPYFCEKSIVSSFLPLILEQRVNVYACVRVCTYVCIYLFSLSALPTTPPPHPSTSRPPTRMDTRVLSRTIK